MASPSPAPGPAEAADCSTQHSPTHYSQHRAPSSTVCGTGVRYPTLQNMAQRLRTQMDCKMVLSLILGDNLTARVSLVLFWRSNCPAKVVVLATTHLDECGI